MAVVIRGTATLCLRIATAVELVAGGLAARVVSRAPGAAFSNTTTNLADWRPGLGDKAGIFSISRCMDFLLG